MPKLSSRHFLCLWYSQRTQPLVPPQPSRSLCKHLMRSTTFAPGRPVVIWDHSPSCHGNRKGTSSSKKMKGELAQTEEEVLRGGRKCQLLRQPKKSIQWPWDEPYFLLQSYSTDPHSPATLSHPFIHSNLTSCPSCLTHTNPHRPSLRIAFTSP